MDSCSVVTKEDCLKILDRFSREKYQITNFKVIPFGSEPLGFLGEHSKLLISVKQDKQHVILQFFMKTIPCDIEAHKEYILNIGVFKKEALLYKSLFSKFHFNTQSPIPRNFLVKSDSLIILEDLSYQGFSVVKDKSKTFDYAQCKCLTETIANFHASSIIFEEQNSTDNQPYRIYDHYKDMLFETTFSWDKNNARCDWLNTTIEAFIAVCKKIDAYKNEDVETPLNKLVETMKQFIAPSKKYRNVINHGDLWSNNIMFNYKDNNVPDKCVLVDFQMARYTPPCYDFLTFLYLTTTKEFHQEHFLDFLNIYYNTFEYALIQHNINPKRILTKQEFLDSCYFYKPAALLESAMFGTIVYLNGDYSKDILANGEKFDDFMKRDRSTLVCKLFDEDKVYRERLESVITQLLDHIL